MCYICYISLNKPIQDKDLSQQPKQNLVMCNILSTTVHTLNLTQQSVHHHAARLNKLQYIAIMAPPPQKELSDFGMDSPLALSSLEVSKALRDIHMHMPLL